MKLKIRNGKKVRYLSVYLLTLFTCFIPIYMTNTNRYNLWFCITIIPVLMFIISNLEYCRTKKDRLFGGLLVLYVIVFGIYTIIYLKSYWAWIYNSITFIMVWILTGYSSGKKNQDYRNSLIDAIIVIFTIAVIVSLLANIIGIDAIYWDIRSFHIRSRSSGIFLDKRLTWVYMHKSSYGLLMGAIFALVLKRRQLPYRNIIIGLYGITALIINSMVTVLTMILVAFAFYLETKKINRYYVMKLVMLLFLGLIVGGVGFYYLNLNRDIVSLGERIYIWPMFYKILEHYPNGMGINFYTDMFWMKIAGGGGRYINNVHNVFLNEILHYSIPVGVLYSILILYIPFKSIKQKTNRLKKIILLLALILPMIFDQAMNDLIFPLYMMALYLCFNEEGIQDESSDQIESPIQLGG